MLRDDYVELTDDPRARMVAEHTFTVEEYLKKLADDGSLNLRFRKDTKRILIHGHCHQKALWGTDAVLEMLNMPPGYDAEMIASGCCGMAGAFGYESEHYETSMAIGEQRLLKAVRESEPEVEVAAPGMSCREQIRHGTNRTARHPIEILWEAVEK